MIILELLKLFGKITIGSDDLILIFTIIVLLVLPLLFPSIKKLTIFDKVSIEK